MGNCGRDLRGHRTGTALAAARRALLFAAVVCTLLLVAGCGQSQSGQSTLHGQSDQTRKIIHLWWGMLAAAAVVFAGALLLLAIAYRRRTREGLPGIGKDEDVSTGLVVAFGVVIPMVCLVILFYIADIGAVKATSAPKPGQTRMNVSVVGHQWFWEVPNLFIADGSVMPTQGSANPALVIMALASRLAERLAGKRVDTRRLAGVISG